MVSVLFLHKRTKRTKIEMVQPRHYRATGYAPQPPAHTLPWPLHLASMG
jgi:hypothetical protein